jgi:hypothetical protein
MARLPDQILEAISKSPGMTDREITNLLRGRHAPQQPVNQSARALEAKGYLVRRRRPDNLIGNFIGGSQPPESTAVSKTRTNHDLDALSEDEIKMVLVDWLSKDGWNTDVAWARTPGIDIDAKRGTERWIIEVKGPGSRSPMRVNYFLGILGETLQRMTDPNARYSIALPDLKQYRGLWARLPRLAKSRTTISLLLVSKSGQVESVE